MPQLVQNTCIDVLPDVPREHAAPSWLLPAPAQDFIELDQREQFIPSGLRQAQLRVEQVTVGIERIE